MNSRPIGSHSDGDLYNWIERLKTEKPADLTDRVFCCCFCEGEDSWVREVYEPIRIKIFDEI